MKILIVDNLTLNSEYIKDLLKEHQVDVQIYKEIQLESLSVYDMFILSGTKHDYMGTVEQEWDNLKAERELIVSTTKPVIGICYGFELIAKVFGSELSFYDKRVTGDYSITFDKYIGIPININYRV